MIAFIVVLAVLGIALVARVVLAIVRDRRDVPLSSAWRDEHAGRRDNDAA